MKRLFVLFFTVLFLGLSMQTLAKDQQPSEKAIRLTNLFAYSKSLTGFYSQGIITHWIDLETKLTMHSSALQKRALDLLDTRTNQLSKHSGGFEWASDLRLRFLHLIDKINQPYQLDYFGRALQLADQGLTESSNMRRSLLEDPLNEGAELSEVDYSKLRVVRQVLNHMNDVSEDQVQKYFQSKHAELLRIFRNDKRRQRLSQSWAGRCALKLGLIH